MDSSTNSLLLKACNNFKKQTNRKQKELQKE